MAEPIKSVTVEELKKMMDEKVDFQLVDVREKNEKEFSDIGGELIPMASVVANADKISKDKMAVVYNLTGSILAWSDRIDSSIKKY